LFARSDQSIIIYIPEEKTFENVTINTGVGVVNIDSLFANNLELHLGIGDVRLSELVITSNADIQGGIGRLRIESGSIENLSLRTGIGESIIGAKITGNSSIDGGIGSVELTLTGGEEDDYRITTQTGLGTITINGERQRNGTFGRGDNNISVNGGVGSITIRTD